MQVAPRIGHGEIVVQTRLKNYGPACSRRARATREDLERRAGRPAQPIAPADGTGRRRGENWSRRPCRCRNAILWCPENPFLYVLETATRRRRLLHALRHARVPLRHGHPPGDAQRQGLLPPRGEHHPAPVLRRPAVRRAPLGRGLGAEVPRRHSPADALERLPASASARRRSSGSTSPTRPGCCCNTSFPSGATAAVSLMRHKLWKEDEIVAQVREFVRDNWNHPSVALWDASNETHWDFLAREADSRGPRPGPLRRPWENGYNRPQGPDDPYEDHPYLFIALSASRPFQMTDLETDERTARPTALRGRRMPRSSTSTTGSGCTATARPTVLTAQGLRPSAGPAGHAGPAAATVCATSWAG